MSYLKYRCKFGNMFFLFCHKCKKHENVQDWMRVNHDPQEGVQNLYTMFNSLGSEHVQINSITVAPETKRRQEFGMANIEKLDQEEEENNLIMDDNEEANVNSITVNKIPIGKVFSPHEVIQVSAEGGIFPVVIIYDTGSEVSLCNYETDPLVVDTKRGDKK